MINILTDEKVIYVSKSLPVDYIEYPELIIVSLSYFKKVIYSHPKKEKQSKKDGINRLVE